MLLMESPLTLTRAALTLGYSTEQLRNHFPDLTRELIARNQERFSFDNVQKRLLAVLADNSEPFPSLKGTAQRLGCSVSILQTRCPDLCRKISERYKEYLHRRHEARILVLCEEVRQTVLNLHEQGIYPSARQVSSYLRNSKLMLTREVHEFWQDMLTELGWKK
jgi:AraC-like DNA-binding protein